MDRYDLRQGHPAQHRNHGRRLRRVAQTAGPSRTDTGETVTAKYIVNGSACSRRSTCPTSRASTPSRGDIYPHRRLAARSIDLTGKRVGVIGHRLHRPAGHHRPSPEGRSTSPSSSAPAVQRAGRQPAAVTRRRSPAIKERLRRDLGPGPQLRGGASGSRRAPCPAMSVSEEERQRVFQENWDNGGGFRFMFGTFSDIATDPEANEAAASFIRSKIAEIVKDPETARMLTPDGPLRQAPAVRRTATTRPSTGTTSIGRRPQGAPRSSRSPRGRADGRRRGARARRARSSPPASTPWTATTTPMDLRGRGGRSINEALGGRPHELPRVSPPPGSRTCS